MSMLVLIYKSTLSVIILAVCLASKLAQSLDLPHKSIEETAKAVITRVEPTYSILAMVSIRQAEILIEVVVDEEGNVTSAYLLSGHALLNDAALTAAKAWKFRPLEINGVRKKMVGTIKFEFKSENAVDDSDNISEEIEALKRQVLSNPNSYQAHLDLARIYKKQYRFLDAVNEYEQAIKLQPQNERLHYELGEVYRDQDKLEEAEKSYARAIRIKPDFLEAYYGLGWTYSRLNLSEMALEVWAKVLGLSSDLDVRKRAYINIASLYQDMGRKEESISAYKTLILIEQELRAKDPDGTASPEEYAKMIASMLVEMGRYKEAIEAYNQAIDLEIKYNKSNFLFELNFNLGSVYEKMGNSQEAISYYKKSISLAPNWDESHFALGMIYIKLRDKNSAMNEYNILKEINRETAQKLLTNIQKQSFD